jgi:hypothetical protein|tara:strand:+ start:1707 stop:1910 length:204 start_codon:yes stop_codon:yes gene_type:complete
MRSNTMTNGARQAIRMARAKMKDFKEEPEVKEISLMQRPDKAKEQGDDFIEKTIMQVRKFGNAKRTA